MIEVTTLYELGFYFKDVPYGWKNKKLFRLPYQKNNRNYSLKEIPFYCFKTTLVANIQREKLTKNRLKSLTKNINILITTYEASDCPF